MRILLIVSAFLAGSLLLTRLNAQSSEIDSSGHALLFRDDVVVKKDFNNFPTSQLTFEAWLSTSDYCHSGAVLSYAIDSQATNLTERTKDFNHFVIFDPKNLIACHDYEYIDLVPDYEHKSCHASYNSSLMSSFVERDGRWHHLAVTWDGVNNGNMRVYQDGMLVGEAMNMPTRPLVAGGALMLGAEQDCFGGCTDPHQGYYGLMDEVRIWNVVRTQPEIMENMRVSTNFNSDNLVAYWKFNDPDQNPTNPASYDVAKDSSKYGNDLLLRTIPTVQDVTIEKNGMKLSTKAITFNNNYAAKTDFTSMPQRDFTIEFWAKTGVLTTDTPESTEQESYAEFLSFATVTEGDGVVGNDDGNADTGFIDDAIRIERYLTEFQGSRYLENAKVTTKGAISLHINANRQGNGKMFDNWLDFGTGWVDDQWHHIAVTWEYASGTTKLFFDGEAQVPFWVSSQGKIQDEDPNNGGVAPQIGAGISRSPKGSLVLGQNQECYGGCFSPSKAFDGQMAVLRIWDRVLTDSEIKDNMMIEKPHSSDHLQAAYYFNTYDVSTSGGQITDEQGSQNLILGASGPTWEFSDAPLTNANGVKLTTPVTAQGYALKLHDKQVLMHPNFESFPGTAITVEFWMKSVDACRMGVPFSYAAGSYESLDNSFLIFDYNDWGVSVMEDEGTGKDHNSGISATDGKWHYIAVTWSNQNGKVSLYQDGGLVWIVQRGKGQTIPSGGTLVIGREQDCVGGCFDSAEGAAGRTESDADVQYGAQDFYGVIDEMRVWNRDLTSEEILNNYQNDLIMYQNDPTQVFQPAVKPTSKGLVAYWTFDEGQGYTVQDKTGNNHHLMILEEPEWVAVGQQSTKRGSSVCGNGRIEGAEQCDDGNTVSGDGCSSDCKIESGYLCTLEPSNCVRQGQDSTEAYAIKTKQRSEQIDQTLHGVSQQQDSSSGKSSSGTVAVLIVVIVLLILVVALVAIVYVKREWVQDHFPGFERGVRGIQDKFGGFGNTKLNYHQYDVVAIDPESTSISADFANSSNGAGGPYAKLEGGTTFK